MDRKLAKTIEERQRQRVAQMKTEQRAARRETKLVWDDVKRISADIVTELNRLNWPEAFTARVHGSLLILQPFDRKEDLARLHASGSPSRIRHMPNEYLISSDGRLYVQHYGVFDVISYSNDKLVFATEMRDRSVVFLRNLRRS